MTKTQQVIEQTQNFGAANYHPLPIVISEAEGAWVKVQAHHVKNLNLNYL